MSSLRPVSGTEDELRVLLEEWEAADDPAPLVIATSGSTGRPKRVMLSRDAMRASALATAARLGGGGSWQLDLPPTYVAGLQVLYRSIVTPGTRRYLSLVPTQLVRAVDDPALLEFDAVLVGGGPLDPAVRAKAAGFGIKVVQTYGMSETCGGCVYDGLPLDGVAVKISVDGEVLVKGPMLFDGYEGEPERTAAAFVDGWLRTNDLGLVDEDGLLRILGRADDVIISGGVKVPPHAVETMLGDGYVVVGRDDPEWGEVVVAVSLEPADLDELRDRVTPRTWAPRQLRVIESWPLLSNGKLDRRAVKELVR